MAVGDMVAGISSITAGNTWNICPTASGTEWVVHNIYYDGAVEMYYANTAATTVKFDADTDYGARLGAVIHCSTAYFLQMKAITATRTIAYDGVITNE